MNKMIIEFGEKSGFDSNLAKYLGLKQILNPNSMTMHNYNVYHIGLYLGIILPTIAMCMFWPIVFYYLKNDMITLVVYFGYMSNLLLSCYKLITILYNSNKIWKFNEIFSTNFTSYRQTNGNIFKNRRRRSIQMTYTIFVIASVTFFVWGICPILVNDIFLSVKNIDGSIHKFRMNIFNMYFAVSDVTYNKYFYIFYSAEFIIYLCHISSLIFYNIAMIMISFRICDHLDVINNAFQILGYKTCSEDNVSSKYMQSYFSVFFFYVISALLFVKLCVFINHSLVKIFILNWM